MQLAHDCDDDRIREARARLGGDVWVKAVDATHGQGVTFVGRDDDIVTPVRRAMRPTPDGVLCLMQRDCADLSTGQRRDLALTVLDGQVLLATTRVQPDPRYPTNSGHGGHSRAVDPRTLPARLRSLAVDAVARTGNRYGSVDIFGPVDRPVVGEVNKLPGGRAPGFLEHVVGPLVTAYAAEVSLSAGAGCAGPGCRPPPEPGAG